MFDNVDLPLEITRYMTSLTPLLAVVKEEEKLKFKMVEHFFWLKDGYLVIKWPGISSPKEVSLNVLKKGDDNILISAILDQQVKEELLSPSAFIAAPRYKNCVINFECEKVEDLKKCENHTITVFKVVSAFGVVGIDPAFNDPVTISKTIEVMSLSPVDAQIIKKKIHPITK